MRVASTGETMSSADRFKGPARTVDTQVDKCRYALIVHGYDPTIINNKHAMVYLKRKAVGSH